MKILGNKRGYYFHTCVTVLRLPNEKFRGGNVTLTRSTICHVRDSNRAMLLDNSDFIRDWLEQQARDPASRRRLNSRKHFHAMRE